MKEILLIKNGEIALKGLNRNTFESILIKNIRFRLKDLGKFNIRIAQSTVYIEPLEENIDFETAVERIRKIFGIAVFFPRRRCRKKLSGYQKDGVGIFAGSDAGCQNL